jgi:hypothetical protein
MKKEHCWKFAKCGRGPGGVNASELGVCNISMHHVAENHLGIQNTGKGCAYASRIFDFEHYMANSEESGIPYYLMFQSTNPHSYQDLAYSHFHEED